ncbi:peptidase S16 [Verticiella sediminum]|uniref:Peptidase S16 n=1 Tax=Verticiella sediminum TaxID=1247510 RepID=A0A556ACD6_9BURK|nr:LON peptidase substrate-binding domain-containing protein [Verticiella sediminum]TSH90552.1 peptidase S16 [Verticiella sediminum]
MSALSLFPLGNALFPDGSLQLRIFEVRYLDLIRRCVADGSPFGVVVLLEGREVRTPEGHEVLADVGTLAHIEECHQPMPGLYQIRCRGGARFRLSDVAQGRYGLWEGEAAPLADDPTQPIPAALQPAADALGRLIASLQRDGTAPASMPVAPPFRLDEAGWVANRWAELLPLSPRRKRDLLAQDDPLARLGEIHAVLEEHGLLEDD